MASKKRQQPPSGQTAFADAINPGIDRANVRFYLPQDARMYINEFSRRRINEKAEWLWQHFGFVKETVSGIARHSVGKGISAQFNTISRTWNEAARSAVERYFLSPGFCDLTGRRNGYEAQTFAVEQYIIRGEFVGSFVENPRMPSPNDAVGGAPCFWAWDSAEMGTPDKLPNADAIILDGVEVGNFHEPLNYWRKSWDAAWEPHPAENCFHWYKPHAAGQVRGCSAFAQAVNGLVDIHELKAMTTRSAKVNQLVSMVIKGIPKKKTRGAMGALSRAATGTGKEGSTAQDTAQIESLYGAAGAGIAYLDAEGDAKLLSSQAPSPLVEPFITDLLMRDASLATGVPSEFFWNPNKLSGANTRFVLARADLFFQQTADALIYRFIEPLVVRFIRWRVASGLLPEPPGGINGNWADLVTWRLPRRVTVDNGRDSKSRIEQLHNGLANLRGLYAEVGEDWKCETAQWIEEFIEFRQMCIDRKLDEDTIEQLLARWRPLPPGSAQSGNGEPQEPPDPQTALPAPADGDPAAD
jgi:capsid protein